MYIKKINSELHLVRTEDMLAVMEGCCSSSSSVLAVATRGLSMSCASRTPTQSHPARRNGHGVKWCVRLSSQPHALGRQQGVDDVLQHNLIAKRKGVPN